VNIDVPESVKRATKCQRDFSCLEIRQDSARVICQVEYEAGNRVLVLAPEEGKFNCPYCVRFGYRYLCTCPTNYAIHNRSY